MSEQTVIGGFTITFNGITPVADGYEWSYTIVNDGTEKDLSHWVLELQQCAATGTELACSLGICEVVNQLCPEFDERCSSFVGIKFDDLPDNQWQQTFTFVLPVPAEPVEGCCALKFGRSLVCAPIVVPRCNQDPPCPPCPEDSLREGKLFTETIELPNSYCALDFREPAPNFYLCIDDLKMEQGRCDEPVEVTLCAQTDSEQVITCTVPLDYIRLHGTLQIIWQLQCTLTSACEVEPVRLSFLAVSNVTVDELCFYCDGERPPYTPTDECAWFTVEWLGLSEQGELSYRVTFNGCEG